MKLIIHSDDFGMAKSINQAVIHLCKLGTMTSTSIMPSMPYIDDVDELLKIDSVSLGLHSTFTQGKPISDPEVVSSLVDSNGEFIDYSTLQSRNKKGLIDSEHVYIELEKQYDFLKSKIGERLVFVDSHHAVHNKFKPFYEAFIRLGEKKNITATRTRQLFYLNDDCKLIEPKISTVYKFGLKRIVGQLICKKFARGYAKHYKIPNGMIVEDAKGIVNVLSKLKKVDWSKNENKVFYIVSHPATNILDLQDTSLLSERVAEYNILASDDFVSLSKKLPLIGFHQL
jgi:predicted glycoside hydrolase/deacetylase ChbG (UPF0249 family)